MEFHHLQSFVQVAQEGRFRGRRRSYSYSPALSLQIKALETELGTPLFERRNRQIFLTEMGRRLCGTTRDFERGRADSARGGGLSRRARQGECGLARAIHLSLYLAQPGASVSYPIPNIDIHLTDQPSEEVAQLLKEGLVDFGIVTLPLVDPTLEIQRLAWREDVIICHPDHPLARRSPVGGGPVLPAEMGNYTLLLLEEGSTSRGLLNQLFVEHDIAPQIMDLGSFEVIKRYVEIDMGISIVPKVTVKEAVQAGPARYIRAVVAIRGIGLVLRRGGYLSPASQRFVTLLQSGIEAVL